MQMILFGMLKAIFVKLATQAFLEFLIIWAAEIAAKSTKTTYDDELVAKIKELLGK